MLIDWFTVGAQALNFLILVWLLKRFLYQPILDAIDAREKRIAKELADADAKRDQAARERDEFRRNNEQFAQQRDELLRKAKDEIGAERQRLLEQARADADALRARRADALQRERRSLNDEIIRRIRAEVFAITHQTLTDLAGTSLDQRMCEVFARRLREMDGGAKECLARALKTSSDPALVRSAFDLPPAQRSAIQNALNDAFSAEIRIRFEAAPDVISGIELTANGQRVAWNIADYLGSLARRVDDLLKEGLRPEAQGSRIK